ncbi:MAG: NAD(P)/FAD-dependent oxidoreductase [Nitrospirae bacterium]|nr:NAD(P)/FAD-dependent oxidoreductase [Nitrospirota bacterium]MBF0592674.1 NAD(P)/FAD-dependent oxidoreductase [Nitrospirota bacterium]
MDRVNITIIGAGVIGLAIAAELSVDFDDILVIERHDDFGRQTSSRNSEVIHSGIYYPTGSLKAELCVEGAPMLYRYCQDHGIAHRRIGKLIVATQESEIQQLEELYRRGRLNGVRDMVFLEADEVARMEGNVNAVRALYSPNTGIIDSHGLMKRLFTVAQGRGVTFSFNEEVISIEHEADGYVVGIKSDDYRFLSNVVINAAGLCSDAIAAMVGIEIDPAGYRLHHCKGSYFSYSRRSPVERLIYPVPEKDLKGLGVHATLDLGGRLRFGPDTEYVDDIDYTVDVSKRDRFYEGACKIIRGIDKDALVADMAGVRPKIKGEGVKDFVIEHEDRRGLYGFINLVGIESPGLTASLAISSRVRKIVDCISIAKKV